MVNKVILLGNVGADPEVKHLDSGSVVANFSLATSETFKNKDGEKVTNTEWHKVVCWRKLAEIVEQYVTKGQQLYVEGKITTRSWDNKEGVKQYITEVIADKIQMLGSKSDNQSNNNQNNSTPTAQSTPEAPLVDDLPF